MLLTLFPPLLLNVWIHAACAPELVCGKIGWLNYTLSPFFWTMKNAFFPRGVPFKINTSKV